MSDKLELYVSTDLNTLAFGISQLDQNKILELFKAVDDMICEYEFTETLAKTFQEIVNKENE